MSRLPAPTMGWSVPAITGLRGAGLGNEAIAWAKAFLGAQELGLRMVHPAWGLNGRRYWRDFQTSRLDWPLSKASSKLIPTVDIEWDRIQATRQDDYALALRALRAELQVERRPLVVRHVSGMSGGYLGIRRARDFLLGELFRPSHVAGDLYRTEEVWKRPGTVSIAVHIRGGDFTPSSSGPAPNEFNKVIPPAWYLAVCQSLRDHLGGACSFLVVTDDPDSDVVRRLNREVGAVQPPDRSLPLLSDVLALASADLLVCSVSSMSMLAAFLSPHQYAWFGPHLESTGGWRSIWGRQPEHLRGVTARNRADATRTEGLLHRGVAIEIDGRVPDSLVARLLDSARLRDSRHDLLLYGVVPDQEDGTGSGA